MSDKNLGLGARDDYDDVDAFGLDQFGAPSGLNPLWGAAVGSGLGTVTSIALRQMSSGKLGQNAEAVGFVVAGLASGAMIAMKGSRAAGWTALASAFLNNGLRTLEQYVLAPTALHGVVIEPTTAFQGARGGLGFVDIHPTTAFQGVQHRGGGMGHGEMPQLVGASLQSASDHVQLVGGPKLDGFASHWGATHWNR